MRKFHTTTSPNDALVKTTSPERESGPGDLSRANSANGEPGQLSEDERDGFSPGPRKKTNPTRYGDWERNGRCIDF